MEARSGWVGGWVQCFWKISGGTVRNAGSSPRATLSASAFASRRSRFSSSIRLLLSLLWWWLPRVHRSPLLRTYVRHATRGSMVQQARMNDQRDRLEIESRDGTACCPPWSGMPECRCLGASCLNVRGSGAPVAGDCGAGEGPRARRLLTDCRRRRRRTFPGPHNWGAIALAVGRACIRWCAR